MKFSEILDLSRIGAETPLGITEVALSGRDISRDDRIVLVDNKPEEILSVVLEMESRLQGNWESTEEDLDLQKQFQALYDMDETLKDSRTRIGAEFLRQNRDLLSVL